MFSNQIRHIYRLTLELNSIDFSKTSEIRDKGAELCAFITDNEVIFNGSSVSSEELRQCVFEFMQYTVDRRLQKINSRVLKL